MVAKIIPIQSITRAIYYNEHKVAGQLARCLYAGNFLKEATDLTLVEKKEWFTRQLSLDKRIGKPALHIPISFAPGEILSSQKLIDIAREYMDRIGFGEQPFLVYQHTD